MSVHYRFKSALEYDTITFDGLHISVKDLKNAIMQQKRIGKNTDFDLNITNAQTQEVYEDEVTLIPKNTSLLVARVPVLTPKQKQWEGYGGGNSPPPKVDEGGPIGKAVDLANLDAPEDDKIKAMMSQSTQDYDPSNYVKIRGANQVGPVPPSYRCYKCHQNGHWIKDCPLGQGADPVEIKKSTGIPHSFMVPVEGPQVPGAMMMSNGQYAVPALDMQAYNQKSGGPAPVQDPKPEIPEDLLCSICSDLLTDAVMIPCCGNSFCDECIRSMLLESEEHECPDCHEKDISPATLIPNRFLRKSVANFKNTTGYEKKPVYKPKVEIQKEEPAKKGEDSPTPQAADSTEADNVKTEEKAVISEADSTEHPKSEPDFTKDSDLNPTKTEDPEGPPGVSPKHSPVRQIISKVSHGDRDRDNIREHSSRSHKNHRPRSISPRRPHRHRKSPNYDSMHSDERQGTPIRDEPPGVGTNYIPPRAHDSYSNPPPGAIMGAGAPNLQAPPPNVPPFPPGAFPPVQGPPPNFRLPPPGSQPPYLPPGAYPVPPRPVFDPALGGGFGPSYRSRDYPGRRGGRERTPPGVIDDPLTAFNRILKEKDEKRARQLRLARRSWSRSRSRSFSRSPPPLASFRRRSRSPRRRSRSRSFSMSRSRSRSFSKSPRRSPLPARRGVATRFHSPLRSPSHRRRNDYDRGDYERSGYRDKPRGRRADSRDRFYDDRERDYDRIHRSRAAVASQSQLPQWTGAPHYQDQQGYQNRYQPPPQVDHHRKFEDIGPPGVEQPPVPGLEPELPPPVPEFEKNRPARTPERRERDGKNKEGNTRRTSPKPNDDREKRKRREDRRSRTKSRSPQNWRNPSPKPVTPEKPKKRRNSSETKEEKKLRHSDEEKRKSKDKRKHRDKKEDKKKKKDKRDKHKSKDRKDKKEEFKQVIPKNDSDGGDDPATTRAVGNKKVDEKKKQQREEEEAARTLKEEREEKEREAKRAAEERKKEERRLRFLEDEKRKREEEARKEELKKKQIEEARNALEEEERLRQEREKADKEKTDGLYDEVIPEAEAKKEIRTEPQEIEDGEVVAEEPASPPPPPADAPQKEVEDLEDLGILELHSMDTDIKMDDSADILAPLPEKSKWEVDEDGQLQSSPSEVKDTGGDAKALKVSNEVLKRAENVIFARAINSIRPPIEIKKISGDRAKLYADDNNKEAGEEKTTTPVVVVVEKPRVSVKDRLGVKVDDPEPRVVRRIEIEAGGGHQRRHRHESERRKPKRDEKNRRSRRDDERSRPSRRRSTSSSDRNTTKKRKKDAKKGSKKEKPPKKGEAEPEANKDPEKKPIKPTTEKRKPTLDEASFEPDYDLELHDEEVEHAVDKETKSGGSSSAESSSSNSDEEERRRKKRKKHQQQKKRRRRDTSSSGSESSSESSDSAEERERRKKKHKKNKKKKKKSKHK